MKLLFKLINDINYILVIFVILSNIVIRLLISYRWNLLLNMISRIDFLSVFHLTNIGYFYNSILPARSGDLIKSAMMSKKYFNGDIQVFSSIFSERLFDLIGFIMLIFLGLLLFNIDGSIYLSIIIFVSITILLFTVLYLFKNRIYYLMEFLGNRIKNKFFNSIFKKMLLFLDYFNIKGHKNAIIIASFTTILIWLFYISVNSIISFSLFENNMYFTIGIISLLFITFSFLLPSTPGNFGVYQYACILALENFKIGKEEAILFSLYLQLPTLFLNLLLGIYSLIVINISKLKHKNH